MKKTFLLLASIVLLSCDGVAVNPDEYSAGLTAAMDTWKKSNECNTSKIDEYTFKNKRVFLFDPGLCGADMFSPIVDEKGITICNLGGIIGNIKCDGVEFEKESKFVKNVWKKG